MKLSWQQIPNPIITEILCRLPLDGIVIDTEHASYNYETLQNCIQVSKLCGKKCFVRLMQTNKKDIRSCLDSGCDGLIFSMIENQNQVNRINKYSKYPSFGGSRGLGLVRENLWGIKENLISKPPVLIAQIETIEGIKNLKEIRDLNVFDYFMIGPYDLSASLGIPGEFDNKKYTDCLEKALNTVELNKMAVHIPKNVAKEIKKYKDYGIIAIGMDTTFLIEKYKEVIDNA